MIKKKKRNKSPVKYENNTLYVHYVTNKNKHINGIDEIRVKNLIFVNNITVNTNNIISGFYIVNIGDKTVKVLVAHP